MKTTRLEAFSDGVIAILITIMVLELGIPHGDNFSALVPIFPLFLSYILSFVYIGIYWNNHHHLLHVTDHVDGRILWANMHLLFWLSLIPFTTSWMAEEHFAMVPVSLYGIVLLFSAVAYYVLVLAIKAHGDHNRLLREAMGSDIKGKMSLVLYVVAVGLTAFNQWISLGIYAFVALLWFIPDRRIERVMGH